MKIIVDFRINGTLHNERGNLAPTTGWSPPSLDSWYGSRKLVDALSDLGFTSILVHGKNDYVMTIGDTTAKLSVHKKNIEVREDQWGCDKPVYRAKAIS